MKILSNPPFISHHLQVRHPVDVVAVSQYLNKPSYIGDNMDIWKDLPKRKKFWYAVGVLVVIALVGWWTGWWASPEVV